MSERRAWLEGLEAEAGDPSVALAFVAGLELSLDEDELRGARRRALLLLAAGGDPRRELELDARAVTAVADDLDEPGARAQLAAALGSLREEAAGLPLVLGALDALLAEPDLAWRCYACALLAEELAEE